ncbi:hypothetical protein I5Q34_23915 [Streptomyces sp. AV19]|uniref:hypothetical protein n=1 Tax=Streptomyces sp. AV19 TaxID=2793068 RepID=UPI0018FEBE86|nr:hypothetical protein [Streptomyces sp. AV19]MBH1937278.1 hypothetical protein [Streptomyces sp. AV19]MDG4536756.1 hypothetical protein [Streptomyces sp. AV19]
MRRVLACTLLLGLLTGCGIERTEVIEFGQPATGVKKPGAPGWGARLYFAVVSGAVMLSSRPADGPVGADRAVLLLLEGPNDAERARGLFSEVPINSGMKKGLSVTTERGRVSIQLPMDVARLTHPARMQLVCTAAHNEVPGSVSWRDVKVTLSGGGKKQPDLTCDRA